MEELLGVFLVILALVSPAAPGLAGPTPAATQTPRGTSDIMVQWFADQTTGAGEWIVFSNDGTGRFTVAKRNVAPASQSADECRGSDFRSPDISGDGLSDWTYAVCSFQPGYTPGVWSRPNDGSGGFGPATQVSARDWVESLLTPGDFDGDGDVDYIFGYAHYGSGPAVVLRNDGGVLHEIGTFNHPCSNAGPVFAHDWDMDGKLDLMMVCAVDYSKVLRGDGNFGFVDAGVDWANTLGISGQGWKQTGVAVGLMDFDGDGRRDDIVVRAPDKELTDRELRVYCGQSTGGYGLCLRMDPGAYSGSVVLLDLEGDGDDDVLLLHQAACDHTIHVYRNTVGALVDEGRLEPPGGLGCFPNNVINFAWVGDFVPLAMPLDVKAGSCPNPLKAGGRGEGVLPAAILGTSRFDVTEVNLATLRLEGVAPLRSSLEDVGTPFVPSTGKARAADCRDDGPDGLVDLTLKFDRGDIIAALGPVSRDDVRVLHLMGRLWDGAPFVGEDVVLIK